MAGPGPGSTFLCVDHASNGGAGGAPVIPIGGSADLTGLVAPLEKIAANQVEGLERLVHVRRCLETLAQVIQAKDMVTIVKPADVHPVATPVDVHVAAPQIDVHVPPAPQALPVAEEEDPHERRWELVEILLAVMIAVTLGHGILSAYQSFKPSQEVLTHVVPANP